MTQPIAKVPVGKQSVYPNDRREWWYVPSSGIWQTVWLEPVAETSIESLKMEERMLTIHSSN